MREEMGWDEKRWDEVRIGEKSSHDLRWGEVWSVKCKCEVWSAGCEERSMQCKESVRLELHCTGVARRSCSWTTTVQQVRAKHARTGLAGARRKFYRWKRCYRTTLRQLPPRVRVLLVELSQQHLDEIAPGQAPVSDLFLARQEPKKPEVKALPSCPRELDGMVDMDMALL